MKKFITYSEIDQIRGQMHAMPMLGITPGQLQHLQGRLDEVFTLAKIGLQEVLRQKEQDPMLKLFSEDLER